MEKDIVDEEIKRAKDEKAKAEIEAKTKAVREAYIEEKEKKQQFIFLYFPELEQTGTLRILFSPIEHSFREGKFPPETDEWVVQFLIKNDPQRFFSEYEDASAYFWELYRKHDLKKNRIAKIDNNIAQQEGYKETKRKQIRRGLDTLGTGIIISVISGMIMAVVCKDFVPGIIIGALFIVITVICVWNLLIGGISDARIHEGSIEKLKKDKTKIGF